MGYYGVSLTSNYIHDPYLRMVIKGTVEVIACSCCLLINQYGRKSLHIFGMLTVGTACLALLVIDLSTRGKGIFSGAGVLICSVFP